MASEQELADMERMSNDYVPDVKGPLVGPQQSTEALIAEYAQADPIYVHKTMALPAKFSHYRTVRGDGNCGWRALAFGYLETLLRLGNPAKIRAETERLKGCNQTLDAVGYPETVYEDFTDQTFLLLENLLANLSNEDSGGSLLTSFNDVDISSAVTYHFRLLTSAWMKLYPDIYSGFLPGMDVNMYCAQNIEPPMIELDHLGLQCLATSVINEAGIAIEVLYLDRSEGEEVNTHRFPVLDGEGKVVDGAPTIRLLYRPGHYDLLYKSEDITDMAIESLRNLEVRLVSEPIYDSFGNIDFSRSEDFGAYLSDIPGFTLCTPATTFSSELYSNPSQSLPTQSIPSPTNTVSTKLAQITLAPAVAESRTRSSQSTSPPSSENTTETKFRGSTYQYEYQDCRVWLRSQQAQAGLTGDNPDMTKKEDPAHYTNDAFQPQIWQPDSAYETDTPGKGSS